MTPEQKWDAFVLRTSNDALEALKEILATGTREHWTDEGKLEKRYSPEAQIAKKILEGE